MRNVCDNDSQVLCEDMRCGKDGRIVLLVLMQSSECISTTADCREV